MCYREEIAKNLTIPTVCLCILPIIYVSFSFLLLPLLSICLYLSVCHSPSLFVCPHLSFHLFNYIWGILPPLPHLSLCVYLCGILPLSLPPSFFPSVYIVCLCGVLPPLPHLSFHLLVFSLVRRSRSRSRDSADEGEPIQERFFRPHFLQAPGDLTVQEGRLCRMDCKVRGLGASLLPAIPLPFSSFWGNYVKYTSLKCFLAEEERKWVEHTNIYICFKSFFSLIFKFLLNMSFTENPVYHTPESELGGFISESPFLLK